MLCQEYECIENRREIERHHRDLQEISRIVDNAISVGRGQESIEIKIWTIGTALSDIRKIVG